MRLDYPYHKILIATHDLDSGYRRLHRKIQISLLCIKIIEGTAYVLIILAFGVNSGPNEYSMISDLIADYDNILNTETKKMTLHVNPSQASIYGYIDDLVKIKIYFPGIKKKAENSNPKLLNILSYI